LVTDITVTDDTKFKAWGERINPTFEKRGAKYVARDGHTMAVGGSSNGNELPKRAIVIVFDSLDKAKEWERNWNAGRAHRWIGLLGGPLRLQVSTPAIRQRPPDQRRE